ncbi:pentapeptide repeat-containing protein [Streptomyces spiralis]|uniref:pentapeptide repeat-containing protein n=1 Tax=Streptomyces spiralis TaxID=66376 RepID=UPI003571612E
MFAYARDRGHREEDDGDQPAEAGPDPGHRLRPGSVGGLRPADLRQADLGRADLGRADLGRADLGRVGLRQADFRARRCARAPFGVRGAAGGRDGRQGRCVRERAQRAGLGAADPAARIAVLVHMR